MTKKDTDLLLKDLCSRLPYDVKVQYQVGSQLPNIKIFNARQYDELRNGSYIDEWLKCTFKPYLFPFSSMTEKQKKQLLAIFEDESDDVVEYKVVDFYNKNHIDYRGLIEKGLAIDATNLNIY